jgi:hypothetical protein
MPWLIVKNVLANVFALFIDLVKTPIGAAIVAFAIAWLWSGWRHDSACAAREEAARKAAEAAAQAQIVEWEGAAKDIARDATARLEEDDRAATAQTIFISNLTGKELPHVPRAKDFRTDFANGAADRPLFLDRDYVELVRAFDAAPNSDAGAARSAEKFRNAGALTGSDRCSALKLWGLRNRAVASEANRRLVRDRRFYDDVRRKFSAGK